MEQSVPERAGLAIHERMIPPFIYVYDDVQKKEDRGWG
jgi:hypothetical protein